MKLVSIILPCYNEEESLPLYFNAVDKILPDIKDYTFEFILVNDGSKDKTFEVMNDLYEKRNDVTIVNESRNFSQNPAISAGLKTAKGDFAIIMDVDLQDPVELIKLICDKFTEGYEIVNPHRASRKEDSYFKRTTAGIFYKFVNKIEGKHIIPENVNCFRGLSRRALDLLLELPENDRYYVSLIPVIGLKSCTLDFVRQKREAGKSKYNISKLFTHAFNIISTSTLNPLYFPIKFGFVSSFLNGFVSLVLLILTLLSYNNVIPSSCFIYLLIAFMIFLVFFAISLVIFFIGINSLYLHNIVINTRRRPDTIISEVKRHEDKK